MGGKCDAEYATEGLDQVSRDLSDILLHTPPMLRIDEPDEQDHRIELNERAARADIDALLRMPGLEEFCEGPSNQGRVSSCTAHSCANGTEILRNRLWGKDVTPKRLSAEGAYNAWREMHGDLDKDSGMSVRECMAGLKVRGITQEDIWTPDNPYQPTPENYDELSIKYSGGYAAMPRFSDKTGRYPEGTDYTLRAWLQHIKVERLPIFVATKIPYGDMRSSAVARTGIRSDDPYKSFDDPGYWHAECAVNLFVMAGKTYIKVVGSWGAVTGRKGYFYIPFENLFSRFYFGICFAPKRGMA